MKKILLVEDDKFNRIMLNRRLELKNFNVLCAHDGQEAIDIAISEIPDLILMDLSIPIKDGLTATKEIKKNKVTMDIPVIAFGGVGNWQHIVDGINIGGANAVAAGNIFHYTEKNKCR